MHIRDYINRIQIYKSPVREIYDQFYNYQIEHAEEPLYMREARINGGLVNSIRHTKSNYIDELKSLRHDSSGRRNYNTNYRRYKNAVLESIAITYPFLKDECDKQKYKVNLCKLRKEERQ